MSDMWKTPEERKYEYETRKSVGEMLEEGCKAVTCMVRGHDKYDPEYRFAVVVSYTKNPSGYKDFLDTKYKCDKGFTWDSAYAVNLFGEPLTVYEYNRIRSAV